MRLTTVSIPEKLQQRLQIASKRHQISASKLAQQYLDKALAKDEEAQLEHMYAALDKVKGIEKLE